MANGRKTQKGATATNRKQWPDGDDAGGSGSGSPGSNEDLVAIVRGLAAAVAEHNLSELVVDTPEVTFTIRRGVTSVVTTVAAPQMAAMAPMHVPAMAPMHAPSTSHGLGLGGPTHAAAIAAAAPAYNATAPEEKGHVVTSPFVGTFYRKPNPDSSDYVKLGDRVKKGQVLCIVEAMKLMNEIEAEQPGRLIEVLVQNGSPVEYGEPLFRLEPA
ncbi:MAG TPA: acetyl-CoA carboxylase biotin carboxyl carrier protein [Kofleriaceae bacterium]|nr:acetyl-CoA carboxylase biotin carboxyl carrier protein [Kofleriaceae bacterium]